jgi:hypothetical protein
MIKIMYRFVYLFHFLFCFCFSFVLSHFSSFCFMLLLFLCSKTHSTILRFVFVVCGHCSHVTPYSPVAVQRRFGGKYCLHIQGRRTNKNGWRCSTQSPMWQLLDLTLSSKVSVNRNTWGNAPRTKRTATRRQAKLMFMWDLTVDKLALRQVSLRIIQFSLRIFIPRNALILPSV